MKSLKRYPERPRELLQAYDSADELLVNHAQSLELIHKRVLVLNDSFGAIVLNLNVANLSVYTDSFVSGEGISSNGEGKVRAFHNLESLEGVYDFVFYRIPKNLSFFEDELCHLSQHLGSTSVLIGTAMVKHLAKGAFDLLEKYIGKTHTSLAEKKARLVFATFERGPVMSPYPREVTMEGFALPFSQASNLFSRDKLDIGTRFFLEHVPSGPFQTILDLGCANGIIGIRAKQKNPGAKIVFSDDSAMAIVSSRINYSRYFEEEAQFHFTNCYEGRAKNSLDLVLCNPPFHQAQAIGDHISSQMFKDAWDALKPNGRLRVIANSHLTYPQKLKAIFGNCQRIATHPKFVVLDAVKNP